MKYFLIFYKGDFTGSLKLGMATQSQGVYVHPCSVFPNQREVVSDIEYELSLCDVVITNILEVTKEQAERFER